MWQPNQSIIPVHIMKLKPKHHENHRMIERLLILLQTANADFNLSVLYVKKLLRISKSAPSEKVDPRSRLLAPPLILIFIISSPTSFLKSFCNNSGSLFQLNIFIFSWILCYFLSLSSFCTICHKGKKSRIKTMFVWYRVAYPSLSRL